MANLHLHPTSGADQDPKDCDSNDKIDDHKEEEVMPPPWRVDMKYCQPKIIPNYYYDASGEDKGVFKELQRTTNKLLGQQQTDVLQRIRKLNKQVIFCMKNSLLDDSWKIFTVWPILNLAQELSGLEDTVFALPLSETKVSPESLLPQWCGKPVPRQVDCGLVIKLTDDINHQIGNLPGRESYSGIGPASTVEILRTHPVFCHIEVKKENQAIDPVVQLGIWASAVYTRWEQVQNLRGSSKDLPMLFGWTIRENLWVLHVIRRLPDGSRHITASLDTYDTQNPYHISLVVATLRCIIEYGHRKFRKDFLDSVLNIQDK